MNLKALSAFAVLGLIPLQFQAQNLKLTPQNIDSVINAMTIQEKATLLIGGGNSGIPNANGSMIGSTLKLVAGAAGTTADVPRLGIPPTVLTDGPAGVRINPRRKGDNATYFATGFPVGVSLASTWNTDLVKKVGEAIGNEVLEYGCDVLLAPGMNIHRSPFCGRNFEYYSEDPLLTGKIAAAYTKGIQSNGVGVSLKHFAGNSQETNRTGVDETIDPRALREIYLKGFEIAVKEGNPWTVMSSYNRLNGPYTQENKELLTTLLRDEWGFDGIVMTDWVGTRNTAAQIIAGNDLMEPGNREQAEEIVKKVQDGTLPMADVDKCVKRILEYIVKTPRYAGYKFSNKPDLKAHALVTRQAATEGMVLLKNDNDALPLKDVKNVALFGICSYDFIGGGTGSGNVNKPYVVDLVEGLTNAGLAPTDELKKLYTGYKGYQEALLNAEHKSRTSTWGTNILPEMEVTDQVIRNQAKSADVAIITLGRQAGEGWDRGLTNDFNLSTLERDMINDVCDAFHAKGKKVIVILNMGGVLETSSWKDLPDAILLAWMPGQEGGNSVADVLTGKENPSGKLTQTWPVSGMDHPSSKNFPVGGANNQADNLFGWYKEKENYDYTLHKEGIDVGYRYFNTAGKDVSYPFGYGMSYTDFSYSRPSVKSSADGFTATVTVTNTGKTAGKEIVQLYVAAPSGDIAKPANELKAFAKTRRLNPGESETLTFNVSNYDLASYHEQDHEWIADKGKYTLKFGASIEDIRAQAAYNLGRQMEWKTNDILRPTRAMK